MKKIVLAAAFLTGALLATADAASAPPITQASIAGVRLGMPASAYKRILGKPFHYTNGTPDNPGQPKHYSRLVFPKKQVSVYFSNRANKGVVIATWNKAYRTAAGVGPCSPIWRLRASYGTRVKPSKFNTIHSVVYAYTLGKNLIFATNNLTTVEAVGLYDGSDPHVDRPGGSLSYAGFITLSETRCYSQANGSGSRLARRDSGSILAVRGPRLLRLRVFGQCLEPEDDEELVVDQFCPPR